MNELISVVIPVYNVEKYLAECLCSVIGQSYTNLQIILVDDGSTDRSGDICDEYAAKDNRITVIHQKNAGAGAAKNTGIENIKGDWVSFIDADDYIDRDFYKTLLTEAKKSKVEVVQCRHRDVYRNVSFEREYCFSPKKDRTIKTDKFLYEYLSDWKYAVFWNKLFRAELIGDTRFPKGRKIDDEFFTYKLISRAGAVANIDNCMYNYRMRKTSVMNAEAKDRLVSDRIDCFSERYDYISKLFPKLKKAYYRYLAEYIIYIKAECGEADFLEKAAKKYPYLEPSITEKIKMKLIEKRIHREVPKDGQKEFFE